MVLLRSSAKVIDATLAAQAREERKEHAMLSKQLQSTDVTGEVNRLATRRREKQRRLRRKFEPQ
jgi:hypothetical protein